MLDFLAWWIAAAVLGAAAVPISSRLLHCLPDRGYAAAKPIGLLVAAYLFWIGGSLGLLHNDRGSVVLVVLVLILAGLLLGSRQRREVIRFFREHGRYVLMVEALFLLVFACFALLRTYAPDITSTEKPFELAFLNGVSRTPFFPPTDVWYSGHAMNYYYFGYVNVDLLNRLTGTPVGIGFNLATPLTAALAAVTIFGLAFNLVKALARAPLSTDHRDQRATVVALSAVGLLLLVSSLEGVLEFLDAHGIGAASFYRSLGIQGLPVINSQGIATQTSVWYPNDQWSFWWWWRATRMGSQWNVMEFPFFSFMLADLHPHVMVIPFALLSLTFTWSLFAGEEVLDGGWWRRNPLLFVLFALLLGSLALLNAWDQPTEFLILFLAVLIANARRLGDWSWTVLRDAVLFLLPLVGMAVLLFLPFWLVFQSPDFIAIAPTEVSTVLVPDVREAMALPPLHLLLFWGPMLWLSLTFLLVHTRRTAALALPSRYVTWPLFLACLPPLAWLLVVLIQLGPGGLTAELAARGGDLLTELILTLAVFLAFAALMREALPYRSSTFNVQRSTFPVRSSQFPVLSSPVASRRSPVAVRGSGSLSAQDHEPGEPMDRVEPPLPLGEDWPAAPTPDTRHPTPPPVVFALIAIAVGLLFLLGAELFYVEQATFGQNRHNTVFKFWYQAWILQSIGGAVGLGYLFSGWRIASIVRHPGRLVWSAATLALLLAALVYPVAATFSRTNGFTGQRRLDGLAYWQSYDPSDYVAARWLAEHSEGSPVLVEAEGPPLAGTYSLGGRISGLSGLPTILGWRDHAVEFHPNPAQVAQRAEDIRTIYRTNDPNLATALLDRYHVRFVVVGGLERQVFPDSDFVKFARLGAAVYQRPGITIYDMTEPPAAAGGSRQSGWTWQRAANSRDNRSDIASSGTVHPYRLPSASNQSEHGSCGMTADCRLAASEASIGG